MELQEKVLFLGQTGMSYISANTTDDTKEVKYFCYSIGILHFFFRSTVASENRKFYNMKEYTL